MKSIRIEKVTATEVFQSQCAYTRGDGSLHSPWLVKANGVTVGQFEVARYQPDEIRFGNRKEAREFAKRLVSVKIYDVFGRMIAVAE